MFSPVSCENLGTLKKMECAVCYETRPGLTLVCGHAFCHGCVKQWVTKGTGTGCPMCRRPVYFKGYFKKMGEWEEESWNNKVDALVGQVIDEQCENVSELSKRYTHPLLREAVSAVAMLNLSCTQKTVRVLQAHNLHEDDIDYMLYEGLYQSDRVLNKKNQYRDMPRELPKLKNRPRTRPRVY